jgi:CubicO group peptidase (beta-lactamase class C family)
MQRLFFLVAAAGWPSLTAAQDLATHPRVVEALNLAETWLDAQRAYQRIPGLSAAVVADQTVVWSGGFGYANRENRVPAAANTIYSICSISKLFTSVSVMQQRDAGRFRLDDPVAKLLPWFQIKRTFPDAAEITVEGLLTHASGLPRESDFPYWSGDFVFPTREQVIERLKTQETLYPAETYWQYSNLGLTLAGEIVQATSGEPYAKYVRDHILAPLGMASTYPDMPREEYGKRLAVGYGGWEREGDRRVLPFFSARGIAPAAGFASTALDLARFASWQFRLLERGGNEVLAANTLREMHRIHFVDPSSAPTWGLGFSVWRQDGKMFVGHGGSCPGYRTQLLLQPNEKVAAIVMTNAIDADASALGQRLYEIVGPAIKTAKNDSLHTARTDSSLAAYGGHYRQSFGGESFVFPWQGSLAMVGLPTDNPVRAIRKLRRIDGHRFRRVRDDDTLAEWYEFEVGADGRAKSYTVFSNTSYRIP